MSLQGCGHRWVREAYGDHSLWRDADDDGGHFGFVGMRIFDPLSQDGRTAFL
jgi:hypothetical protein